MAGPDGRVPSAPAHGLAGPSGADLQPPALDPATTRTWIYPLNVPLRTYQHAIVSEALFKNTLVCLPTGLGKTFIAAAVMYNFRRWCPDGLVLFMAPTKPLVAQQIDACRSIVGLAHDDCAELTGKMPRAARETAWQTAHTFFLTPQTAQNDIALNLCPAHRVICVVVDEAHRATGNYAYCGVVRAVHAATAGRARILALSATPGKDCKTLQAIVSNLMVAHIEFRDELSADVSAYTHRKEVSIVSVPVCAQLARLRERLAKVIADMLKRLTSKRVFYEVDPAKTSVHALQKALEKFASTAAQPEHAHRPLSEEERGSVRADFGAAMGLMHGLLLLTKHGAQSAFAYFSPIDTALSDPGAESTKRSMARRIALEGREGFGQFFSGLRAVATDPEAPLFPKLGALDRIVREHFQAAPSDDAAAAAARPAAGCADAGDVAAGPEHAGGAAGGAPRSTTCVIVFTSFRDSVFEITGHLRRFEPLGVRATHFIGQGGGKKGGCGKGQTQKEQRETVERFRTGEFNVLVCTCIGEEGLDIGTVDLIVCYDTVQAPTRLVQRLGRTGRHRAGRCVVLVNEGADAASHERGVKNSAGMKKLLQKQNSVQLYADGQRILPAGRLECVQLVLDIPPAPPPPPPKRKRARKAAAGADADGAAAEEAGGVDAADADVGERPRKRRAKPRSEKRRAPASPPARAREREIVALSPDSDFDCEADAPRRALDRADADAAAGPTRDAVDELLAPERSPRSPASSEPADAAEVDVDGADDSASPRADGSRAPQLPGWSPGGADGGAWRAYSAPSSFERHAAGLLACAASLSRAHAAPTTPPAGPADGDAHAARGDGPGAAAGGAVDADVDDERDWLYSLGSLPTDEPVFPSQQRAVGASSGLPLLAFPPARRAAPALDAICAGAAEEEPSSREHLPAMLALVAPPPTPLRALPLRRRGGASSGARAPRDDAPCELAAAAAREPRRDAISADGARAAASADDGSRVGSGARALEEGRAVAVASSVEPDARLAIGQALALPAAASLPAPSASAPELIARAAARLPPPQLALAQLPQPEAQGLPPEQPPQLEAQPPQQLLPPPLQLQQPQPSPPQLLLPPLPQPQLPPPPPPLQQQQPPQPQQQPQLAPLPPPQPPQPPQPQPPPQLPPPPQPPQPPQPAAPEASAMSDAALAAELAFLESAFSFDDLFAPPPPALEPPRPPQAAERLAPPPAPRAACATGAEATAVGKENARTHEAALGKAGGWPSGGALRGVDLPRGVDAAQLGSRPPLAPRDSHAPPPRSHYSCVPLAARPPAGALRGPGAGPASAPAHAPPPGRMDGAPAAAAARPPLPPARALAPQPSSARPAVAAPPPAARATAPPSSGAARETRAEDEHARPDSPLLSPTPRPALRRLRRTVVFSLSQSPGDAPPPPPPQAARAQPQAARPPRGRDDGATSGAARVQRERPARPRPRGVGRSFILDEASQSGDDSSLGSDADAEEPDLSQLIDDDDDGASSDPAAAARHRFIRQQLRSDPSPECMLPTPARVALRRAEERRAAGSLLIHDTPPGSHRYDGGARADASQGASSLDSFICDDDEPVSYLEDSTVDS